MAERGRMSAEEFTAEMFGILRGGVAQAFDAGVNAGIGRAIAIARKCAADPRAENMVGSDMAKMLVEILESQHLGSQATVGSA